MGRAINILLVEDSETDAELALAALNRGKLKNTVHHVSSGEEALRYLNRECEHAGAKRPDLILLDLNMPGIDGREVLKQVRNSEDLSIIPIVVLTTSAHDKDILASYGLNANNYVVKPVDLNSFFEVIQSVESFWVQIVTLPPQKPC
jgi:CheY-like chemotaxis protein